MTTARTTVRATAVARTPSPPGPAVLPPLPGDLYGYEQLLPVEDQEVLLRLREWLAREAEAGSDVAGPLATTARRDGDPWVLDGAKRWLALPAGAVGGGGAEGRGLIGPIDDHR